MNLFYNLLLFIILLVFVNGCNPNTNADDDDDNALREYNLSVEASPDGAGIVEPSEGTFQEGAEVIIEATANEGWQFVNWSGDRTSEENPLNITISEDVDLTANFEQQQSFYKVDIMAIDAEDTLELSIGQAENATTGFDSGIDEEAPPSPPAGALHAYFTINELNLFQDFRNSESQQVEWRLHYQLGSGQELTLEWDIPNNPQIPGTLILTDENNSFEVNMVNNISYTINNTSGVLIINYSI